MFPIRCYTCNTVLAHVHPTYRERVHGGESVRGALDALGVTRMCCRRMFLSHVESLVHNQLEYPNTDIVLDKGGTRLYRECRHSNDVSCD